MYDKKNSEKDVEITAGVRVEKHNSINDGIKIGDSVALFIQSDGTEDKAKQTFNANEIALCYMGYIQPTLSILETSDTPVQKCKLCGIGTMMEERILCPTCIKKYSAEIYKALSNDESIKI